MRKGGRKTSMQHGTYMIHGESIHNYLKFLHTCIISDEIKRGRGRGREIERRRRRMRDRRGKQ